VHATAVLNGGGAPLKLRSTAGKIRLQYLDSEVALRDSLIREQIERISQRIPEFKPDHMGSKVDENTVDAHNETKTDWLESWLNSLEVAIRGGVTEDAEDFQKRLVNFPKPSYPALAQRAGLQGLVRLQVRVKKDGSVEVQKLLEGDPALADAAIAAVKQWRARPASINGKQIEVISTVTFNFQLH
jgi:TonB family protein